MIEYYKCPFCHNIDKTDIPHGVCYECTNVGPRFVETLKEPYKSKFIEEQKINKEQREKGILLEQPVENNNDKVIWKANKENFLSEEIIITETGGVGINCGGHVIVLPIRTWHELAKNSKSKKE